jgi:hypothetical protein
LRSMHARGDSLDLFGDAWEDIAVS